MGTAADFNWRRSRHDDIQGKAGTLFQHMMAKVLDCIVAKREEEAEFADIYSRDLGIRVEVKSRNDNDSFQLRVEQIKEYSEEEPPFPINDSLYALVPYIGNVYLPAGQPRPRGIGKNTKNVSITRLYRNGADRNRFWSEHVETSYLLDLRIVQALKKSEGIGQCSMVGRSEEDAIRLSRTRLAELFSDSSLSDTLRKFKLQPSAWAKGAYPIHVGFVFDGQRLSSKFNLITVLPRKGAHLRIAKVLAKKTLTLE